MSQPIGGRSVSRVQDPGFGTVGAESGILRFCKSKEGLAAVTVRSNRAAF
jgi:hypothetical protein